MPLSNWPDKWPAEYTALEAERDRLREALERIASAFGTSQEHLREIAREALGPGAES